MRTRAAILYELGLPQPYAQSKPLTIEEIEFDSPGFGEVVVKIASAGLCHSDLSNLNGTMPKETPLALGHEAAGIVEDVGAGVTEFKPGDHVIFAFVAMCGHCEKDVHQGRTGNVHSKARGQSCRRHPARRHAQLRLHGKPVYHHLGVTAFTERTICAQETDW